MAEAEASGAVRVRRLPAGSAGWGALMPVLQVTLTGNVVPLKNSRRIVRAGRRMKSLPSKRYEVWARDAGLELNRAWRGRPPLTGPVQVTALFYRTRDTADLDNLEASIGDLLQTCRVVANDRQIRSWDNSRIFVDRARPRVEVTVREMVE